MRFATVRAQTHPGTGVIAATLGTIFSKSASQYTLPSTIENHTSIITTLSGTMSDVSRPGTQAAITTRSELSVYTQISGVLLSHDITVAQAFINRFVIGFPTILLFPTTVTIFPIGLNLIDLSISITPAGVQQTNPDSSPIMIFH